MRIRVFFAKNEAMRFTGHLDLFKTWERTFRRAGLPLAYSQGFNPHPRLNLASALPLGFTSQDEILDAWLETNLPVQPIVSDLQAAAPPGIQIQSIVQVDERLPALQTSLVAADYQITLLDPIEQLDERIQDLRRATGLPRVRRGKAYDLRPLIHEIECIPAEAQATQRIFTRLSARESATGRPEEVLQALGIQPEAARIHRLRLIFQEE